jgi:exosome complex component RRP4
MGDILIKDGTIVIPGEILARGMDYLPSKGTFRENEDIISSVIGTFRVEGRLAKVTPLKGKYIPKRNDMVIGKVIDVGTGGWRINIDLAFNAGIPLKDGSRDFIPNGANLSDYYEVGDIIVGKITEVKGPKIIDISMNFPGCRKLIGGRLINVETTRVPRIIGKEGSMIKMIKEGTGSNIMVGQNGKVWISNQDKEKEYKATLAVKKVNDEAFKNGLTEEVKKFLEGK